MTPAEFLDVKRRNEAIAANRTKQRQDDMDAAIRIAVRELVKEGHTRVSSDKVFTRAYRCWCLLHPYVALSSKDEQWFRHRCTVYPK